MTRSRIVLVGVALSAGLLTACGSDTADPSTPTASSVVSALAESTTTASSSAAVGHPAANCAVSELRIDLGQNSAAAGTTGFPIVFTNTGRRTCTLAGFPGVSYVNRPTGDPLGPPAIRIGKAAAPVSMAPGQQASALVLAVNVQNYPTEKCRPTQAAGLRIYPPDSYESVFVTRPSTACTSGAETTQLKVNPIVAGTTGQ